MNDYVNNVCILYLQFEKKQWFTRRPSGAEEFALFAENFAESEVANFKIYVILFKIVINLVSNLVMFN